MGDKKKHAARRIGSLQRSFMILPAAALALYKRRSAPGITFINLVEYFPSLLTARSHSHINCSQLLIKQNRLSFCGLQPKCVSTVSSLQQ